MKSNVILVAAVFLLPTALEAKCRAKIVGPAVALQSQKSVLKAGEEWGPPTQILVKNDKSKWICAHGDYCYDAHAIKLLGCRMAAEKSYGDEDRYIGLY